MTKKKRKKKEKKKKNESLILKNVPGAEMKMRDAYVYFLSTATLHQTTL